MLNTLKIIILYIYMYVCIYIYLTLKNKLLSLLWQRYGETKMKKLCGQHNTKLGLLVAYTALRCIHELTSQRFPYRNNGISGRIQHDKDLKSKSSTVPAFIWNLYLFTKNLDNFHCYYSIICISLHDPKSLLTHIYIFGGKTTTNLPILKSQGQEEQKRQ